MLRLEHADPGESLVLENVDLGLFHAFAEQVVPTAVIIALCQVVQVLHALLDSVEHGCWCVVLQR